ncbi:MAG: translocation/assembly module TamB domain-containing protein [Gemmatimonadetes bacterium]|nr:translocation/assembly module TamB domain-containing protein [Gemmatimonadota bacterium]
MRRGAFGAIVALHNVRIRDAHFELTLPWEPDDTLYGARRDSAIAENLRDPVREIRRVTLKGKQGFQRTWHWTDWNLTLNRARFRDPDSTGRQFDIARMDVVEHVPPFQFRNMRGTVRWLGDSIWVDFKRFELPHSVAAAKGKLDWGDNHPIRWDIRIHSDSTGLEDIHWIHSTLPRRGGGSMDLRIVNEKSDLHVVDYVITNMDLRTGASRLRGAWTFGVGAPVLLVKDIDLQAAPVDFTLFETLNGGPFPQPWHGAFTGTVRGRGGPVTHLLVDDARLTYTDANVPGAIARGTARGEIDILNVSETKFHGLRLDLATFDLRTAQFLNADFPRLAGTIAGSATLDSVWTDVRVRDADLIHVDGDTAQASHFRGKARATLGGERLSFDVDGTALPLSMTAIARSYPRVPLRGAYSGPFHVNGTIADMTMTADLAGDGGRLQFEGQADAESPAMGATVRGALGEFDFRRALGRDGLPTSRFNGRFELRLEGDSLANVFGTARFFADRSTVDSLRVYAGQASLRFGDGVVRVDSLRMESTAGLLTANGTLGIAAGRSGTLNVAAVVDSLCGLRRYLVPSRATDSADTDAGQAAARAASDSLGGTLRASGTLSGEMGHLTLQGVVEGASLRVGRTTARALAGSVRLCGIPDSVAGVASLRLDTLRTENLTFTRVATRADVSPGGRMTIVAAAVTPDSTRARAEAMVHRRGDTTEVRLDSLAFQTSANAWALRHPSALLVAHGGFRLDSFEVAGIRGGRVSMRGAAPTDSAIALEVRADSMPLADLGELLQTEAPLGGRFSLRGDVRGTREHPDLRFDATLGSAAIAGMRLDAVTANGRYADRRLTTSLEYARLGIPALHAEASLPIDLSLAPAGPRLLDEPLSARLRTDSAGLVILEAFSRAVTGATGSLALDVDVAGTWKHPRATGALRVHDGALRFTPLGDATFAAVDADIAFLGDSVAIRGLSARTGAERLGIANLTGWIGVRDVENPDFDLSLALRGFNAIARPIDIADLDLTGDLRLAGTRHGATLTGGLLVDRGVIPVPELYQKQVISLDDPEFLHVVDTSAFENKRLFPRTPSGLLNNLTMRNVQVQMGRDVWLRSAEANINLGGKVNITSTRVERGANADFALDGSLQTVRGTYRLNLGIVQRPFDVEGGEVRWFGDPDFRSATLSINALHTVRQFSQQAARPDVHVRVHIGGTLRAPVADLSSPDSLRVTNADLISYLVTGGPSYEIGGRGGDYTSTAARVLLSSSFSVLGSKATGNLCDDEQLSTAGLDAYQGRIRDVGSNILAGTRFNCAKQVSDRAFVRLDAGLCQVGQLVGGNSGASDPLTFADAIGLKLDYRLTNALTLSAGMDPPTSAVLCTREANARGFAPTPRQYGFDLFRLWRF